MSMLPIWLILASAAAAPHDPVWPENAVVLVVAGWCAPCHQEVGRLDAIAGAAAGRRLRVVGLDQSSTTRALLAPVPERWLWRPSPAEQRAVRDNVYAASAGLPYAVATDSGGRPCAELRLGLDGERTRALVARCGR